MSTHDSSGIHKIYRRIGLYTCSSVFLLFLLGALVRATGSGMGCPDWPKCFGLFAPPTCECQLPANYVEIFKEKREKKVHRFVNTLHKWGFHDKANQIASDPNLYTQEKFDPVKAWIEYINRLFGVLSGLFALVFAYFTLRYGEFRKGWRWMLVGFVFLILNAWLGSLVVATNLLPGIVSLHFLLSYICLFGFIKAIQLHGTFFQQHSIGKRSTWLGLWFGVFVIVILGTWAREMVDTMRVEGRLLNADGTMLNFEGMGVLFAIHRFLPGAVLTLAGVSLYRQESPKFQWNNHWFILTLLSFLQIALGAIHIVYVVPVWVQIAHVVLGSSLLTYLFLVLTSYRRS